MIILLCLLDFTVKNLLQIVWSSQIPLDKFHLAWMILQSVQLKFPRYCTLWLSLNWEMPCIMPLTTTHLISVHLLWQESYFHLQQMEEYPVFLFLDWVISAAEIHCFHSRSGLMKSSRLQQLPSKHWNHQDQWTVLICSEAFVMDPQHIGLQLDKCKDCLLEAK